MQISQNEKKSDVERVGRTCGVMKVISPGLTEENVVQLKIERKKKKISYLNIECELLNIETTIRETGRRTVSCLLQEALVPLATLAQLQTNTFCATRGSRHCFSI